MLSFIETVLINENGSMSAVIIAAFMLPFKAG
jgi:hypothetical protein